MDYTLPTDFDLIVVGTGIVESMVSAAASRAGKKVLQVDKNSYYGGHWSSFNLEDIQNIVRDSALPDKTELKNELIEDGHNFLPLCNKLSQFDHFKTEWHVPEKSSSAVETTEETPVKSENSIIVEDKPPADVEHHSFQEDKDVKDNVVVEKNEESVNGAKQEVENVISVEKGEQKQMGTQEYLKEQYRKFVIDLMPKLHFARGAFVELLISSNIARYTEFRSVSRVLTWINGNIEIVPCSRSDVFANNKVSVVEKRMLMKLLTSIETEEKNALIPENTTYKDFMKGKKLSNNIIHFVLYALSMSTDKTLWLDGIQKTKRFLDSLGRYGKTPFLFSMYGSGEITQAFCRLSAVFGGVFALNQPLHGIEVDKDNKFTSLICGNQKIKAPFLVIDVGMAPEKFLGNFKVSQISRAILITDRSLMEGDKEHLSLLIYPSGDKLCIVLELGSQTGTCPKDIYLVHITTKSTSSPREDFQECVSDLFSTSDASGESTKPRILWSSYFSMPDTNEMDLQCSTPANVFLCPGPDIDLDLDLSVSKAKEIFASIYPNEEFLPRAPDADEIIIENESDSATEVKAVSSDIDISIEGAKRAEIETSSETEIGVEVRASNSELENSSDDTTNVIVEEGVEECVEAKEN